MKVKWYGHAAFLLTSDQGFKVITDPYEPGGFGGAIAYGRIPDEADVVLVSHDHADHNYVKGLSGKPKVIQGSGTHRFKDLEVRGIASYHDEGQGSQRGENTIFCFTLDGLQVCHLGDLGHIPTEQQVKQIGPVDLLLMPIGGVYTIDSSQAALTAQKLNPRVIIPMHFKTPRCGLPLAIVEEFTKEKASVKDIGASEFKIEKENLPPTPEIIVLQPAL
ncbi:MAG: MBL fold metallo-hydrolase [Thermodesulfobacteriota bacterium]|nr:MBL fold metallo-hydrolase [Thermodesulfobacteriota bacterium]